MFKSHTTAQPDPVHQVDQQNATDLQGMILIYTDTPQLQLAERYLGYCLGYGVGKEGKDLNWKRSVA